MKAGLKCRTITYTGEFEPVKWTCRAPLPSGKLCPRMDRHKVRYTAILWPYPSPFSISKTDCCFYFLQCPFHGPIIPRDDKGQPCEEEQPTPCTSSSAHDLTSELTQRELLMIANDQSSSKKGKRKKKDSTNGLTSLKNIVDTPRSRIEKKIFNK